MENQKAVDQVVHNSQEQAMMGDFPSAVQNAVITSMNAQNALDMEYLSKPEIAKQVEGMVYQIVKAAIESGIQLPK